VLLDPGVAPEDREVRRGLLAVHSERRKRARARGEVDHGRRAERVTDDPLDRAIEGRLLSDRRGGLDRDPAVSRGCARDDLLQSCDRDDVAVLKGGRDEGRRRQDDQPQGQEERVICPHSIGSQPTQS
jgi:hypothetical protein